MAGYTDYMVLLRPDDAVCSEISSYKNYANRIIGDYPSMHSTAHISIMKYIRKKPYVMQQAIDILQVKLKGTSAVKLQLNNFNYFIHKNDTYTIYAAVAPTLQSDNWFAALSKHLQLAKGSFIPHLTIARTINADSFLKLWPHFRHMKLAQPFDVNCLTILERETLNSHAKWAIYKEIRFEHKAADILV